MKDRPQVIQNGLNCIERNTTFAIQKACALRIFAEAVQSDHRILEVCDLAATCSTFCTRTIRKWANDVFGGYFSIISNIDDVTDETLQVELQSSRGRHPKRVSLMSDENVRKKYSRTGM